MRTDRIRIDGIVQGIGMDIDIDMGMDIDRIMDQLLFRIGSDH